MNTDSTILLCGCARRCLSSDFFSPVFFLVCFQNARNLYQKILNDFCCNRLWIFLQKKVRKTTKEQTSACRIILSYVYPEKKSYFLRHRPHSKCSDGLRQSILHSLIADNLYKCLLYLRIFYRINFISRFSQ